ncbi:MAG: DUF3306 domain-containing protein [Rhodomicrobiaceae bacterium]
MSDPENTSLLSRWSRRKRAAREGEATEAERQPVPETAKEPADAEAIAEREAELEANRKAAEAVDLTKLDKTVDFSVFMKAGVPALLRKQAMAALWRSDPVYANVDGLVDYGDDFGSPDLIMKTFKSAWQSGRGYLKEELVARAEDAAAKPDPATADARNADEADPDEAAEKDLTESAEAPDMASEEDAPSKAAPALPEDVAADEEAPFAPEEEPIPRVSLRRRFALEKSEIR